MKEKLTALWVFLLLATMAACSADPAAPTDNGGQCAAPNSYCEGPTGPYCAQLLADANNCGTCGLICQGGKTCGNGACVCPSGMTDCNGQCVDLSSDPNNCGACGTSCGGQFCSVTNGVPGCSSSCAQPNSICSDAVTGATLCVDTQANVAHCGGCNAACEPGSSCSAAGCVCADGAAECAGTCCAAGQSCNATGTACVADTGMNAAGNTAVDNMTAGAGNGAAGAAAAGASGDPTAGANNAAGTASAAGAGNETAGADNAGAGGDPVEAGTGNMTDMPGEVTVSGRNCPAYEGLIADFEEGSAAVLPIEGRLGEFEGYSDGTASFSAEGVEDEGSDECNKGVFHIAGSGFTDYVGMGATFASSGLITNDSGNEEYVPVKYDANASGFVGIAFRAKSGSGQSTPVRIGISTPGTEGDPYGAGTCDDSKTESQCWNHVGHFLVDDEALSNSWQDYTLCFDRDMYPMYVPNVLTAAERHAIGANLLKFQVQFNQAFDPQTTDQYPMSGGFDFYIDDIRLVKSGCDKPIFESSAGTSQPFGTNAAVGSCAPIANAEIYNRAITEGYLRWRDTFVGNDGTVFDPEQGNKVISEGIAYGMLLSAAMGDKALFDRIWGWAQGKMGGGLLGWDNGNAASGSATDADTDMAYALYMADKQWGGYAADAADLASKAAAADLDGTTLKAGSQFSTNNPSYFSPGFYRKLGGSWTGVISPGYSWLNSCDQNFSGASDGIIPDWCNYSGNPLSAADTGANVTSETCPNASEPCSAYDASRIPWRVGYDVCFDSAGAGLAARIVQKYDQFYSGRIDLLEAGWGNNGAPYSTAVQNEMAFIGTVAVSAWATNNAAIRDRAFQTTLDLLERPEYYKTYYSTTLGLLTLTLMTGNWPVP